MCIIGREIEILKFKKKFGPYSSCGRIVILNTYDILILLSNCTCRCAVIRLQGGQEEEQRPDGRPQQHGIGAKDLRNPECQTAVPPAPRNSEFPKPNELPKPSNYIDLDAATNALGGRVSKKETGDPNEPEDRTENPDNKPDEDRTEGPLDHPGEGRARDRRELRARRGRSEPDQTRPANQPEGARSPSNVPGRSRRGRELGSQQRRPSPQSNPAGARSSNVRPRRGRG